MQVALLTEFAVTKKEPLAVLLERIHAAFLASGLGEPSILFTFSDSPVGAFSTIIDCSRSTLTLRGSRASDRVSQTFRQFARSRIDRILRVPVNLSRLPRCSPSPWPSRSRCRYTECRSTFTRQRLAFSFRFPTWRPSIRA
jgi:hypothetical protein